MPNSIGKPKLMAGNGNTDCHLTKTQGGKTMASIAKMIEISADSEKSFEDALQVGIQEANESLRNVNSVWIKDQEVLISNGVINTYRLHLKVSFTLER